MVEHVAFNHGVDGSIPSRPTIVPRETSVGLEVKLHSRNKPIVPRDFRRSVLADRGVYCLLLVSMGEQLGQHQRVDYPNKCMIQCDLRRWIDVCLTLGMTSKLGGDRG